jgi:hypothetical protein
MREDAAGGGGCQISTGRKDGHGGAGDGNRTRTASLEGWDSTIELHPRPDWNLTAPQPMRNHRFPPHEVRKLKTKSQDAALRASNWRERSVSSVDTAA